MQREVEVFEVNVQHLQSTASKLRADAKSAEDETEARRLASLVGHTAEIERITFQLKTANEERGIIRDQLTTAETEKNEAKKRLERQSDSIQSLRK